MNQDPQGRTLRPTPVTEVGLLELGPVSIDQMQTLVIGASDDWLSTAYRMLASEFDPSVLDPYERYVEWIDRNRQGTHSFPFLMVVGYLTDGQHAHCLGVVSGNLMPLAPYVKPLKPEHEDGFIFALGHQVTASCLRSLGIRGVGKRLWSRALEEAAKWARERDGKLLYSFLEAEPDSIGFWTKQGYRWPKGLHYWQPPLEFDSSGAFRFPEVPELPLLMPFESTVSREQIDRDLLQNMIATVYQNWSLAKYRTILSPAAMQRAESYVMGEVFGRVCRKMPAEETLPLIEIRLPSENAHKTVRSVALNNGLRHSLRPLKAPRLSAIGDFDDMLTAMKDMAFGARTLGEASDILYTMARDPQCKVVLTLSGAGSIAKLDFLIAEMIERNMVHCIITTGAVITHGFNAERGSPHFKMPTDVRDSWLYEQGYNRIYDTIETEYALDELETVMHSLLEPIQSETHLGGNEIVNLLANYLSDNSANPGMILTAVRQGVPILIPAFTDSELGLDFALHNHYRRQAGKPKLLFNPFLDFERYCEFIRQAPTRGLITLGGGVPRNWAQQIGPYLDAIERKENAVAADAQRFKYAVRICPEPEVWGGLSGSTYSEGVSWGKFIDPGEGGRLAEVPSDYTLVFPILIKGLFQRLEKSSR
jgi:deoxyhypusine synthase